MPIKVACVCGISLSVPDSFAGQTRACPKCKKAVAIPEARREPAVFGLAPVAEPKEKIKPLLFDQQKKRERCQQCGMYVEDADVLCDRCAGRTAKQGAKIARRNMRPKDGVQPGAEQVGQLKNIFLMPLFILAYPFIALFAMCFPRDSGYSRKRRGDDDVEDE